ncbi:MAG: AMP-binding protein [Burkholderiaceae bacterium]|nr:AMP-binding protein [Burkholderiaceae bacterium]
MRRDPSGWATRVDDETIARFGEGGQWTGVTLARCARERARNESNRVAVVDGERRIGFAPLYERGVRLASALRAIGLQRGDVISFQLPNWHEAMVVNLAASIGGFVCNPIIPIYRDAEVGFILKQSRTRVLFVPTTFRSVDYLAMVARLRPSLPDLREVVLVRDTREGYRSFDRWMTEQNGELRSLEQSFPDVDPNDVKLLLYTSGTTGDPKGVLHTHNTLRAEIDAVISFWAFTERDVVWMPSPVTHITGYLYALELPFATAMKAVLMERWDAAAGVRLIEEHGASFSIGATPFLVELVSEVERRKTALPSLRLYGSGGAPVPPEVVKRATQALPNCLTFRVYGSSEAPTVSLGVARGDPVERGATTDGRIVNNEVRIVDGDGNDVEMGREGEILVRGPEVMVGYTDPRHNAEAFDEQGFFRSGDLGFVDEHGYITVSGRKKDLIIRGGENISPKEIEDVLHRHPAIVEAAVVAMPHSRLGETACAYVALRPGSKLELTDVVAFLEDAKLARQKFPERLVVVDELPHTASGKVLKHVLRARIASDAREG